MRPPLHVTLLLILVLLTTTLALSANHRPPKPGMLCAPTTPGGYPLVFAGYSNKGGNLLVCSYDLDAKFTQSTTGVTERR